MQDITQKTYLSITFRVYSTSGDIVEKDVTFGPWEKVMRGLATRNIFDHLAGMGQPLKRIVSRSIIP